MFEAGPSESLRWNEKSETHEVCNFAVVKQKGTGD